MSIEKEFDVPPNKLTLKQASYAWRQSQAKFVVELDSNVDALFQGLDKAYNKPKQEDEKDNNDITTDDMQ